MAKMYDIVKLKVNVLRDQSVFGRGSFFNLYFPPEIFARF